MNRNLLVKLLMALVFAALFVACNPASSNMPTATTPPGVVTAMFTPAKRGDILRWATLPGNATPNQQAALYAKVGGYLKEIRVDKGDEVHEGDLLAKIEVPELLADLARLQAEFEAARINYQRITDAQAKSPDLITRQCVDEGNGRYLAAKAALDRAHTLLDFCEVRAPFAGVITRRFVDPGAFIPAATTGSAAPGNPIVNIADPSIIRVQTAVPEQEAPLIQNGLPADATFESLPGQTLHASISRSSRWLDPMTKTLLTEIDLKNDNHKIIPGMYATIRIGLEKHTNAVLVPAAALVVEKNGTSVFVVHNGKASKTAIKTGFNDGSFAEIVDGAIENEIILARPSRPLNDGDSVQTAPAK